MATITANELRKEASWLGEFSRERMLLIRAAETIEKLYEELERTRTHASSEAR